VTTLEAPARTARRRGRPGRGFQPLRDLPVVLWLTVLVAVVLVHPWVPAPRWLMLHLLLLGAVSHAIHVWSQYFADTLLHAAPGAQVLRARTTRLGLHNTGAVAVVTGVLTGAWPLSALGAAAVGSAAAWHGWALGRQLRTSLQARFAATVAYYVAAASLLPAGAAMGAVLATDLGGRWHGRVLAAHILVNLLGWVGLTVLGTLQTLWPTMLRTRIAEGAGTAAQRALPLLVVAVLTAAGGALAGLPVVVGAGVATYLVGTGLLAAPFVDAARRKPPQSFSTWSVLAGVLWLVGTLSMLAVSLLAGGEPLARSEALDRVVPLLAAGFAAQTLLGALSYLVPVALGGGPTPVRAATAVLDRGSAFRVAATNAGLLVMAFPSPSIVRVLASLLVLGALGAFLPLLVLGLRASRRAKRAVETSPAGARGADRSARPRGQLQGLAASGLAAVVLAVAAGVALDPLALSGASGSGAAASAGATPTGETTRVEVRMEGMRYLPGTVEVPAGDRLVLEVVNVDEGDVHDLVLDSGARTARLSPGESETLDVGVVGRDLDGWCSVVGHRQMGMELTIDVTGAPPKDTVGDAAVAESGHAHQQTGEATGLDPAADPGEGFTPYDATLPPLTDERVRRVTLTVQEVEREVTPGRTQNLWTYDGTAPGPALHGRVGDVFEVTLVNDGSIGHSVDFHAGAVAPDRPMRTIAPGESLVYRFTAERAGIWMYHCATMPMSAHIGNGMFGAVVVEPRDLPAVERSYVLVQSELHLGPEGGVVDTDKLAAEQPDAVVFNGYADQYAHRPLRARAGERVRIWLLDAGPNRATSFHVVGGQFDTVYAEGAYLLRRGDPGAGGAQSLALAAAQGGFAELTFPEPGSYPFLTHVVVDAERGARGVFTVR
jgi:nitrite reductase (NO-forming)